MPSTVVVLMARRPIVGQSKTRLCPPLTPAQAAALAEALLRDSIDLAAALPETQLAIAASPPDETPYFEGLCPAGTLLVPVEGRDIGEVLDRTLTTLLAQGFEKALAFNADGPTVPPRLFGMAAALLDGHDVVYGPSADGGFWLVGLTRPQPSLFYGIQWSTPEVMRTSLAHTARAGLRAALLPEWFDVDTPADLERLRQELRRLPPGSLAHSRAFFESLPPA